MTVVRLLTTLIVVAFCALTASTRAESASVDIKQGDSWFGIYVDGVKQGSLHLFVDRKKGATGDYYSIAGQENRAFKVKDRDITESYDYKSSLGLDLKPISYEARETKGSTKNTIKARVADGVAELTIQFGSAEANPPRKVSVTDGDCWSFCAPYAFAARKYSPDKPRRYGKIVEIGCAIVSFNVAGSAKKTAFQGTEKPVTEWVETEAQKFTLLHGEDGSPLAWSETTKAKVTTKYVSEPEEVAKSPLDFDQFLQKANEEAKKPEKRDGTNLKGTRFENALKPVEPGEEYSTEHVFIRDKANGFSIRASEGWHLRGTASISDFSIEGKEICPPGTSNPRLHNMFNLLVGARAKKPGEKPLDVINEYVKANQEHSIKGEPKTLEFDGKTTVVGVEIEAKMITSGNIVTYYVIAACSDTHVFFVWPSVAVVFEQTKDAYEKYSDRIDEMMGSFRIIDTK